MRRAALAAVLLLGGAARADLSRCAAKAKDAAADLDAREASARADKYDPVGSLKYVVEEAAGVGDGARVSRLVDEMERLAAGKVPTYEPDVVRLETTLAEANALAGRARQARAHFDAARAVLPKLSDVVVDSAHGELLIAALVMKDEALAAAEEKAFLAAVRTGDDFPTDLVVEARFMAYAGAGRRALPWADLKGVRHDAILGGVLEGVKAQKDLPFAIEILGKYESARDRMLELQQLWVVLPREQTRSAAFVAAVKAALAVERRPGVDDFARNDLVEVAADVGLTSEALAVAGRIESPWARARAEAQVAEALATVDPKAGAALARAALKRAATRGARTGVDNDTREIDGARHAAAGALARAGLLDEAKRIEEPSPYDVVIGLRGRADELERYWKTVPAETKKALLAEAAGGDPLLAALARFCE